MRAVIVRDGAVVNAIEVDPENVPDIDGLVMAGADIGDLYDGEAFIKPPVTLSDADKVKIVRKIGRAWEEAPLTVNSFTESFTEEHRRNMKEAVDLLREVGHSGPIMWKGETAVDLDTMVAWLVAGGQRRQKRFSTPFDHTPYETAGELEAAYHDLLNGS